MVDADDASRETRARDRACRPRSSTRVSRQADQVARRRARRSRVARPDRPDSRPSPKLRMPRTFANCRCRSSTSAASGRRDGIRRRCHADSRSVGEGLQPGGLVDRVGRVDRRLHMDRLRHVGEADLGDVVLDEVVLRLQRVGVGQEAVHGVGLQPAVAQRRMLHVVQMEMRVDESEFSHARRPSRAGCIGDRIGDRLAERRCVDAVPPMSRRQVLAGRQHPLDRRDDCRRRHPWRRDARASSRRTRSGRSGWRCSCRRCPAPSHAPARTSTEIAAPGLRLPEGAMPMVPVTAGPRSERMSPNRLLATTTSKLDGRRTKCAVRMSMWYCSVAMSGRSSATARKRSSQNGMVWMMPLDLVAEVSFFLRPLAAQLEGKPHHPVAAGAGEDRLLDDHFLVGAG